MRLSLAKVNWLRGWRGLVVDALLALAVCAVTFFEVAQVAGRQASSKTLRVGDRQFLLEIATTPAAQAKGLSGRASLPMDQGMLFTFAQPVKECFWMKGMRFPLDITWIDANKQVAYVASNINPNTYPHIFCPPVPAQYVIELNAGAMRSAGLHVGQTLNF